jgi:hypothetical protein
MDMRSVVSIYYGMWLSLWRCGKLLSASKHAPRRRSFVQFSKGVSRPLIWNQHDNQSGHLICLRRQYRWQHAYMTHQPATLLFTRFQLNCSVNETVSLTNHLLLTTLPNNCWQLQPTTRSLSDSELLYDWRFTASQLILAPSSLSPTTSIFSNWALAVVVLCNIFSDERMGLSFTIATGPRQRRHSRVRDPRDSWPYFTVSDSRPSPTWRAKSPYLYPPGTRRPSYTPRHWVPFSSPSTTRRATVEEFEPAFTRASNYPAYNVSARTTKKTHFFYFCIGGRFRGKVPTEPLLRNGSHNPVVLMLRALLSNGSIRHNIIRWRSREYDFSCGNRLRKVG